MWECMILYWLYCTKNAYFWKIWIIKSNLNTPRSIFSRAFCKYSRVFNKKKKKDWINLSKMWRILAKFKTRKPLRRIISLRLQRRRRLLWLIRRFCYIWRIFIICREDSFVGRVDMEKRLFYSCRVNIHRRPKKYYKNAKIWIILRLCFVKLRSC